MGMRQKRRRDAIGRVGGKRWGERGKGTVKGGGKGEKERRSGGMEVDGRKKVGWRINV